MSDEPTLASISYSLLSKVRSDSAPCCVSWKEKQTFFIIWVESRQDASLSDTEYLHLFCSQRGQTMNSGYWDTQTEKSAINTHDYSSGTLCLLLMYLHCAASLVHPEEEDGEDNSSQQSQTHWEAQGQHICRLRNITRAQHFKSAHSLHVFLWKMQLPLGIKL